MKNNRRSDQTITDHFFPSWRLGYRSNPFRALTRDEWLDVALLPELFRDEDELDHRVIQILGEKGSGKTSILLALEREWGIKGVGVTYAYVGPNATHLNLDLRGIQLLLLDEAQRLPSHEFEALVSNLTSEANSPSKMIFTSHLDLMETKKSGSDSSSLKLEPHSADFIHTMVERRLAYFERAPSKGVRPSSEAMEYAIEVCDSNLRTLEHLLYEAYQTWQRTAPISKRHLAEQVKQRG